MQTELIKYPDVYKNISYTSQLFLVSTILGFYNKIYDLALSCGIVYFTSYFFWIDPDNSYRRYLDIIMVQIAIYYHVIRALESNKTIPYYILVILSSYCGICSFYNFKQKKYNTSTLYHMLMHVGTNGSLHILYTSNIKPFIETQVINMYTLLLIMLLACGQMYSLIYYVDVS
jgi:hypothetical protein